ncbi:MAG: DUF1499 domain-containing protein [Pseudomonadota bacterium]
MFDFATLEPPSSPNTYLVCTAEVCEAAPFDRQSPVFEAPAEAVKDAWFAMISDQPRITNGAADDATLQYEFIQRSRLFRFPDTVTVRFVPLEAGRSTLAVYSRSKYGYGDMGANKRRVENWLSALEAMLAKTP